MLYLVGLGLGDEKDITVRGLEAVKKCDHVYLEAYTSILLVDKSKLVSRPVGGNDELRPSEV
jgi:diphthine synthase